MPRWNPVTIAGGAYADDTRPWAYQDTVNYLPVPAERAGTRSPMITGENNSVSEEATASSSERLAQKET